MTQEGTCESLSVAQRGLTCAEQAFKHSQAHVCASERRPRGDAPTTWGRKGQQFRPWQSTQGSAWGAHSPARAAASCPTDTLQAVVLSVFSLQNPRFLTPLNGRTHSGDGGPCLLGAGEPPVTRAPQAQGPAAQLGPGTRGRL